MSDADPLAIDEQALNKAYDDGYCAALEKFAWRPIETAPKDGTRGLLYCPGMPLPIHVGFYRDRQTLDYGVATRSDSGWVIEAFAVMAARWQLPTHWMPLPEPPETEK